MNIGEAAKKSGLTVKTVRYYDEINLIKPVKNKVTNYRQYTEAELAKLQFIGKARRFNFSIKECKELLSLYENQNRSSKEVRDITLTKISEIDNKLKELKNLREQLSHLVTCCKGNERPECAITTNLSYLVSLGRTKSIHSPPKDLHFIPS
jgi:MerR family copper efflux transcriptional regulator